MKQRQIRLLKDCPVGAQGTIFTVDHESDSHIYFYDTQDRLCMFYKNEEGVEFEYVVRSRRLWLSK